MAINPNFTFADPALQAQVVNMAQVQAAADAARAQQMTQTLAELSRQRQAAADREERRAVREGDIRRQEGATAENRRQFDESLKFNREAEASRTTTDSARRKEAEQREQYSALLREIEKADGRSLPTGSELKARIGDLLPQHKTLLVEARDRRFAELKHNYGLINSEINRLNALIGQDDPTKPNTKLTADTLRRRSAFSGNLIVGPDNRLQSLLIAPREDAEPGAAAPGAGLGAEPIGAVLSRLPGFIASSLGKTAEDWLIQGFDRDRTVPGMMRLMMRGAGDPLAEGRSMAASRTPFFVPSLAPGAGGAAAGMGGMLPPGMLGNRGVLAPLDYSGPEYDYSRPRFAVPPAIDPALEELLAPPVFAPQY